MFTWLKQFIGLRSYKCSTLIQVLSKSNFGLIVFFTYSSPPLAMTVARRLGMTSIIFLQKPCPSPNVPIANIWAIKIPQAEVGWEGDHKPQLPEA